MTKKLFRFPFLEWGGLLLFEKLSESKNKSLFFKTRKILKLTSNENKKSKFERKWLFKTKLRPKIEEGKNNFVEKRCEKII